MSKKRPKKKTIQEQKLSNMKNNNNEKGKWKIFQNKITPKIRKRVNIALWSCFGLVILGTTLIFTAIAKGHIGYVPSIELLENPIDRYASQVISDDGVLIGVYSYSKDNRILVKYGDLSPELVHALIATEDNRFAKHSGIDIKGLVRAVVKRGILMQKSGGGGRRISHQLANQFFSPSVVSVDERVLQKPI